MAKTKKQTKTKNKGIFGKSFNLQSRRVQFFVSIFIIAIIGGGYFTFRSFAAAETVVSIAAANAEGSHQNIKETGKNSGKNGITVARLDRYGYVNGKQKALLWKVNDSKIVKGQFYRVCAAMIAEQQGKTPTVELSFTQDIGTWNISKPKTTSKTIKVNNFKTYETQCTDGINGWGRDGGVVYLTNQTNNPVRISSLSVQKSVKGPGQTSTGPIDTRSSDRVK